MALNRRVLGAGGLVVAGAVAAAIVGQLPALGVVDHVLVATPSSAPQALVCPGPALAIGASGTAANTVSATGRPARTTGTAGGAKVGSTALKRGNVSGPGAPPRSLTAPAASSAGAIAGAQVEQVTGGDAAGLVATACTTPQSDLWFAAGATTTGRTSVLTLANPSPVAADVAVRIWTEDGPVEAGGVTQVSVPAKSRRAVSLAGYAPSAGGTVVRITSTGGRIGAALEQRTVRGLESGGVDVTGATTGPARSQVIPGIRVVAAAAVAAAQREDDSADLQPVVRVLVPGAEAATVTIRVTPDSGGKAVALGRRVAAGVVTDFALNGLGDGTYTVRVTADRPFVTGARTATVGDSGGGSAVKPAPSAPSSGGGADSGFGSDAGLVGGDGPADEGTAAGSSSAAAASTSTARGIDLAWFAAAPVLSATAAVAVVDAPSPLLTIANPGRARTVRLSGAVTESVAVPAGGAVAVPLEVGLVVLRGAGGAAAAVSYAGDAALAGYPVSAADQQARAVRVSR